MGNVSSVGGGTGDVEEDGPGTDGGVNATPTTFPCDERNK
jgi:hypothetical protein